jgi:hypothetical protein
MILDPAITLARKSALAYVGAIALTGDRVNQAVNRVNETVADLAKRGEKVQKQARTRLRKTAGQVREIVGENVAEVRETVRETAAEDAGNLLVKSRGRLLDLLNIPIQSSLLKLNFEVARLSAQIDELRGIVRRSKPEAPATPLPGYDRLNVEAVLERLPEQTAPTLLAIRAYEQSHGNRITVLRAVKRALVERQESDGSLEKLATHTTVEPLPRYAELRAEEIVERLHSLSRAELLHTRAYEQDHQARITVLRALEERLAAKVEA